MEFVKRGTKFEMCDNESQLLEVTSFFYHYDDDGCFLFRIKDVKISK